MEKSHVENLTLVDKFTTVNKDGTYDLDFEGDGTDGLLLCSVTEKDLGLKPGEKLDLSKPITLTRHFMFHTID